MEGIVVALLLIQFSGPTGQRIDVNPEEVTSVRDPHGTSLLAEGVHCVIGVTNGKFISLSDDCETVRAKLEGRHDIVGPCALVCGDARRTMK